METNEPPTVALDPGSIVLRRVHVGSQVAYTGRLEALPDANGRLEASFASDSSPALRIGQHVEVCYEDRGTPRTFLAQAISRRSGVRLTNYRFRIKWRASEGLGLDLNRRRANRVEVDEWTSGSLRLTPWGPGAPMQGPYVLLAGDYSQVELRILAHFLEVDSPEAILLDLSASGAQALAPFALEALLFDCDQVLVSFRLGDSPTEPCVVAACIRWRELGDKGVRYGLQFLFEDSAEQDYQSQRITAYVEARRAQGHVQHRSQDPPAA